VHSLLRHARDSGFASIRVAFAAPGAAGLFHLRPANRGWAALPQVTTSPVHARLHSPLYPPSLTPTSDLRSAPDSHLLSYCLSAVCLLC
jgi:hypothetical protein